MNQLSVNSIFSDYMVLQRNQANRIWGLSSRDGIVDILVNNQLITTACAYDGKWAAYLPPMNAATDLTISIFFEQQKELCLFHVAVGEVWLAGGQSNMEFILNWDEESKSIPLIPVNTNIRFFDCPKIEYHGANAAASAPSGMWLLCTPEHVGDFSAVAYYFAQKLYHQLAVPIGIIGCNLGGTSAASWMEESYLAKKDSLRCYLNEYEAALQTLPDSYESQVLQNEVFFSDPVYTTFLEHARKNRITDLEYAAIRQRLDFRQSVSLLGPKNKNRPSGLFHTMVEPIMPYGIRGILWYQGESDATHAHLYYDLCRGVIECFRDKWKTELPFLMVQLAPFDHWLWVPNANGFAVVRQQQDRVAHDVHGCYLTSTMDCGMFDDIHPKRKRPVGERLALLAFDKVYGIPTLSEPPEPDFLIIRPGRIRLHFRHAEGGLSLKGAVCHGLAITQPPINMADICVCTEGEALLIQGDFSFSDCEVTIDYAMTGYVEGNLFNQSGIPAKPFHITQYIANDFILEAKVLL